MTSTLGTTRRTRALRLLAALGVGFVFTSFIPSPAGGQEDEFINGSGQSYAQIYRAGPTAGRLSLAPIFGLSLSDYLNTVGRGEAKVADWAGIGVAERALPDNTPSLKVSSTQKDSEKGVTEYAGGQSDGTNGGGVGEMFARATDAPFGEARYRQNSLTIPGLVEIRDNQAYTSAGIFSHAKGKLRRAAAETDIGAMVIADGLVVLKGMRWSALQQTGSVKTAKGTFTVEGVTIGGVPLPLPGGPSDLKSLLDPINAALAPTGFAMSLPVVEVRGGQAFVTPLSLDIINSPLGRQFLAPVLEGVRPGYQPVIDAYIQLSKDLAAANEDIPDGTVAVLAADLALGIFSGSSQLHLEFGGVSSYTEGTAFDNPFVGGIDFSPPNLGTGPRTVTTPGSPGTPPVPGSEPTTVNGEFASGPVGPGTRTVPGDKGGVAVAVGLIGIFVALGLGTADWFKMRASRKLAGDAVV